LGLIFPFFDVFESSSDGILANENRSCTIAHPETLLKRANWAPQLTGLSKLWIWRLTEGLP
jgi:hypothetical protein